MACGKVIFSQYQAHMALTAAKKRRTSRRNENRVYFCTACPGWHLTKEPSYERRLAIKLKRIRERKNAKRSLQSEAS